MATRETAAQKRTRIALLLADYDARSREMNKLKKIVDGMKAQLKELPAGTYGDWILSTGTAREIADAQGLKALLSEHGLSIPMRMSDAPIVVTPKASTKVTK